MGEAKKLEDIKTIDELNEFIGGDELTHEEYQDLVNFVLDNNKNEQFSEPTSLC